MRIEIQSANRKDFHTIEAEPISLEILSDFSFAVHQSVNTGQWSVTEISTGLKICIPQDSREAAIENAIQQIERMGIEATKSRIRDAAFEFTMLKAERLMKA